MRLTMWMAIGLTVLAAGCAAPKKQAFNRDAAVGYKTMAITQNTNKEFYEAGMLGHPGAAFGLIGGLIAAADIQSKSNRLTESLKPHETKLQERLSEKLKAGLNQVGYESSVVVLAPETTDEQILEAAKKKAGTDTVLAIGVVGKYLAAGPSTDYLPYVLVKAPAMETKTGNTLYEDTFTYGYTFPHTKTVHLPSDPKYRFANIDALVAEPEKTRQGLIDGLDAIVMQIVADLKKN
jgi:hypothetical protein